MLTITQSKNGQVLRIKAHYVYKDRIKESLGAIFDFNTKMWCIPTSKINLLLSKFDGELYFKTPLWKILKQPKPEKEDIKLYQPQKNVPTLKFEPYRYQQEGIQFMIDRINELGFVLNSDAVGLGKTIQAIGTFKWFMENDNAKKILIICKKSIKGQWGKEIRKFSGYTEEELPIFITGPAKKSRISAYEGVHNAKKGILITNYHSFLNDSEYINETEYDLVIIDEVHSIKGHEGKMNNLIKDTVQGTKTIFLTGTPIMSKPYDIYGIVRIADENYFGSFGDFSRKFLVTDIGLYGEQIVGAKNLNELSDLIHNFMIRRTEDDVSIELPEVVLESIETPRDSVQDKISSAIQDEIDELEVKLKAMLKEGESPLSTKYKLVADTAKRYLAAKQFASDDPRIFKMKSEESGLAKEFVQYVPKTYNGSSKTEATIELVEDIINSEKKVIIFCHFRTPINLLASEIEKKLKVNVLTYSGAESEEKRERNVELFTEDGNYNILIGNEACAEGLNLQAANYEIHYEQADTYAQKNQRIGRIRRIGSEASHSHIYDIITEGLYDEAKMKKIERDKDLSASLIG